MTNYRLVVAYDGAGFHGFQRQPGLETVQGCIESALGHLFGEEVKTTGAGRTDAGVHALGQVVSFRSEISRDPADLQRRLNGICGPAIAVLEASEAPDGFDARFSAEARTYEYAILTRDVVDPFSRHTTWHHPRALDTALMGKAAHALLGEHSFESFGRVEEGKSPMRRIESIDIERGAGGVAAAQSDDEHAPEDANPLNQPDGDLITIRITANSYLQQMVRSIVGTLVKVGEGDIHPDDMDKILHARDRAVAGPVAPPHGLFLVSVGYPLDLVGFAASDARESVPRGAATPPNPPGEFV